MGEHCVYSKLEAAWIMHQKMCFWSLGNLKKHRVLHSQGVKLRIHRKNFLLLHLQMQLQMKYDANETSDRIFKQLNDHLLDLDPMHNIKYLMIKAIVMKYILIRKNFMCNMAFNKKVSNRQVFMSSFFFPVNSYPSLQPRLCSHAQRLLFPIVKMPIFLPAISNT